MPNSGRDAAISRGPAATPAPMRTMARGIGPANNGNGVRSGIRRSSPYAPAFAAVAATGADSAKPAATTLPTNAKTAFSVDVDDNEDKTNSTASGAATRSAVSDSGRRTNSAAKPAAHATHSSVAAVCALALDQLLSASPSATPVVTGSNAHAIRAHHTDKPDPDDNPCSASSWTATSFYPTNLHGGIGARRGGYSGN